jgi:hypothetical protein
VNPATEPLSVAATPQITPTLLVDAYSGGPAVVAGSLEHGKPATDLAVPRFSRGRPRCRSAPGRDGPTPAIADGAEASGPRPAAAAVSGYGRSRPCSRPKRTPQLARLSADPALEA